LSTCETGIFETYRAADNTAGFPIILDCFLNFQYAV